MHRSTHEPQFRHTKHKPKHVDPRELEASTSTSGEDDSTDRDTEETSEETTESQECHSMRKRSEWNSPKPTFEVQKNFYKPDKEKFVVNPYEHDRGVLKLDKITQKNLLSPFPSLLISPISRQVTGAPYYRLTKVGPSREEHSFAKSGHKPERHSVMQHKHHLEDPDVYCTGHKSRGLKERRFCEKHQAQRNPLNSSKACQAERVLTCYRRVSGESPGLFSVSPPETEEFTKHSTSTSKSTGRRRRSLRKISKHSIHKCPDCFIEGQPRRKSRGVVSPPITPVEKGVKIQDSPPKNTGDDKSVGKKCEVKEKLVYVVEEEGKDVTKLETDLFTLNEILAIKKDLVELSEFAKKLKKLKEMKKESENGKTKGNMCQCKQAEELLRDVNRRIEALETRQEELERGGIKLRRNGDTDMENKKTKIPKTSAGSLPKSPTNTKTSAMTTAHSVPKTEIFVERPHLSKNSEIVHELMDIKTQLLKLEKRRMSKEGTDEASPLSDSKPPKKKEHAIAVFSSRTYILTPESFDRKKEKEEKKRKYFSSATEETSKTEMVKANVSNWLKEISVEGKSGSNVTMLVSMKGMKKKPMSVEGPKENINAKCKNGTQAAKIKDVKNQEPHKNRGTEIEARFNDNSVTYLMKKEPSIIGERKYIKPQTGRIFDLKRDLKERNSTDKPLKNSLPPVPIRRSVSSGSITSAILAKQQVRRLKAQQCKSRNGKGVKLWNKQSKSMEELSLSSSIYKGDKSVQNKKLKDMWKSLPPVITKDKTYKDKNEFFKYLETQFMALKQKKGKFATSSSSYSYSEFLASVNLETQNTSQTIGSATFKDNFDSNQLYTYPASGTQNRFYLDSLMQQKESCFKDWKKKEKQLTKDKKSAWKKEPGPEKEKNCKKSKKFKRTEDEGRRRNEIEKKPRIRDLYENQLRQDSSTFDSFFTSSVGQNFYSLHRYYSGKQQVESTSNDSYSGKSSFERSLCQYLHEKRPMKAEDSLEIYRRRFKEKSKKKKSSRKVPDESFAIRDIFRNLGRYYPKLSNFHLLPLTTETRDGKKARDGKKKDKISKHCKKFKEDKDDDEEDEEDDDDDDEDDDDDDDDENEDSDESASSTCECPSVDSKPDNIDRLQRNVREEKEQLYHSKNCDCVKVFLQTQNQGWSGLGPFRVTSTETLTGEETSKSLGISVFERSDLLFPRHSSDIRYVGHATEDCKKKKKPARHRKCSCRKEKCCELKNCHCKDENCCCRKKTCCGEEEKPSEETKEDPDDGSCEGAKRHCKKQKKCRNECCLNDKKLCKKKKKCMQKDEKSRRKRNKKCEKRKKREEKKRKKYESRCVCSKCGNVHKIKKKKKCKKKCQLKCVCSYDSNCECKYTLKYVCRCKNCPLEKCCDEKNPECNCGEEKCCENKHHKEKCSKGKCSKGKCPRGRCFRRKCCRENSPKGNGGEEKCHKRKCCEENCPKGNVEEERCPKGHCGEEKCLKGDCREERCPKGHCGEEKCLKGDCREERCLKGDCREERCPKGHCGEEKCPKRKCCKEGCPKGHCGEEKCPKRKCCKEGCSKGHCGEEKCPKRKCCKEGCSKGHCSEEKCPKRKCCKERCPKRKCGEEGCHKGKCEGEGCPKGKNGEEGNPNGKNREEGSPNGKNGGEGSPNGKNGGEGNPNEKNGGEGNPNEKNGGEGNPNGKNGGEGSPNGKNGGEGSPNGKNGEEKPPEEKSPEGIPPVDLDAKDQAEKQASDVLPLFSNLFTNFCKTKTFRETKFSRGALRKINEFRCPGVKKSFLRKWREYATHYETSSPCKENTCSCVLRLDDIETRLGQLEKEKSCGEINPISKGCLTKNTKKSSGANYTSCNGVDFRNSGDGDEERKCKRKTKVCSDCLVSPCKYNRSTACYYAFYSPRGIKGPFLAQNPEEVTLKATVEESPFNRGDSKDVPPAKHKNLKKKFSSFHSFLKSIKHHKVMSESEAENRDINNKAVEPESITIIGDYSKSNLVLRNSQGYVVKRESINILKKLKENQKLKRENQKKEKHKKEKHRKEKQTKEK